MAVGIFNDGTGAEYEVQTYADALALTGLEVGDSILVNETTGVWILGTQKKAGYYRWDGVSLVAYDQPLKDEVKENELDILNLQADSHTHANKSELDSISASDITNINNLTGTNTGDEVQATENLHGIAEIATQAEVDDGTDDTTIITPLKLANWSGGFVSSITTTTTISSQQDDFNPAGLEPNALIRVVLTGNIFFTGLDSTNFNGGEKVILKAVGGIIRLRNNDSNSIASNRFLFNSNYDIRMNNSAILVYDNVDNRWTVTTIN